MLALFRIDPSVSRTPNNFTPRLGQVLELCPLLLQCEHRRVIPAAGQPAAAVGDEERSLLPTHPADQRSELSHRKERDCPLSGAGERRSPARVAAEVVALFLGGDRRRCEVRKKKQWEEG